MSAIKTIVLFLLILVVEKSFTQSHTIDSLQKIISERKGDLNNISAFNNIAAEYARIDMVKAQNYLHNSIDLSQQIKNEVTLSNAWCQMITLKMNMGQKDSSQYYLQLLKVLASDNSDNGIQANLNLAAGLFYKKTGNFKESLVYMIAGLNNNIISDKKNSTISSKTSLAGQYLNIGNTYKDMGNYKNAIAYHLNGLNRFEEVGNKRGISFCLQGICADFIQLNQFKEALPYNKRALDIKTELNDKRGVASSYENYGTIYKRLNDYNKALFYFNEAMVIFHEMKLLPDEATVNMELARINVIKKDIPQANLYFEEAKTMALQLKDSSLLKEIDVEKIAMQNNDAAQKKSEQKLVVNLKSSIEMADINKELASYKYLADYYAGNKEFDKALEYTNRWHKATDSVQSTDVQVQIKKMEEQYNFNKKEQEIALLKKDQQLSQVSLQKQKTFQYGAIIFLAMFLVIGILMVNRYRVLQRSKQLIAMERMRNNIARDLHDDIGSTLTSINILSKVALQQRDNSDSILGNSMQKIKDRSSAIMESMGDIVWAINPQNDTFEHMIFRMKEFTSEILDPLNISYHFKEEGNFSNIKLDIKKRKDFYLLFKEAVNNAAKYSNCKNLEVYIKQDMQNLHLKVTDDGIGFNEKIVRNGNGLVNMRERSIAMNANINIESANGKGTVVAIDVPIT
ncbi:MAG: tetratricopeptide repeat protein [Ferruginibacter sp.]